MTSRIVKVVLKNYKSIEMAEVDLDAFTVFVGPNGAGKSNFLDALAFVQECLAESVELAFKNRGGIGAVRRKSQGHPRHIGIRLIIDFGEGSVADYSFEIAAKLKERFSIARERCIYGKALRDDYEFEVRDGRFVKEIQGIRPALSPDRLALFAASATEEFRPVYDFLTSMHFYSINPTRLRELQEPDSGERLKRDGSNAAAVLKRVRDVEGEETYRRVCRLLSKVVPGLEKVEYKPVGQKESLQFKQNIGQRHPWSFDALNMSDGTLRVLGNLLAVYQAGEHKVVAIEEPEMTVHPAVTEVITQVLLNASEKRQILVTTHSPDILDFEGMRESNVRVVWMKDSKTMIRPISQAGRDAIHRHLYTAGELLRYGELNPEEDNAGHAEKSSDIFGKPFQDGGDE